MYQMENLETQLRNEQYPEAQIRPSNLLRVLEYKQDSVEHAYERNTVAWHSNRTGNVTGSTVLALPTSITDSLH